MSTTKYGTELDLVCEQRIPEGRLAIAMLRVQSVWRAFRNRLASNCLHDLDDRQLNDIGLTRHDVVMALDRSGSLEDPSLLLTRAARERARTRFARSANR
ncbi:MULTISPECIES: DUF1127 domain-containing protein [Rhizobium/Agrobacterium group]|uniref:DUF1127 domain-containing protein n=1 Tax=Neorhizobium petrolearium TaxID=515361 RepID=A0ABY8M2X9_9HYPH|nr:MULTISPECIES: DUF1127 domain-containing protein [Rhizobium/Agrobacterium group]KGD86181.1 hypothetical protein JL39_28885 [Rhizobium sp. YS-1r]MCC2608641.1 DUF1127 domain-containing protein [Neorhizobium petrolearium]WGI68902.1 DUF1127 domain-containing protein [Neorhizobium petrolearium]